MLRIFPTISWTVEQSTYELAHHHGIEQSCSKSYKICCFWRGRKRNRLLVFIEKLLIHLFAVYMSFFYVACPMSYTLQDPPSVLLLSLKGERYCWHFVGSKGFFVSNLLLSSNRCKSFFLSVSYYVTRDIRNVFVHALHVNMYVSLISNESVKNRLKTWGILFSCLGCKYCKSVVVAEILHRANISLTFWIY